MGTHKKYPLVCKECGKDFMGRREPNHTANYCSISCASKVKIRNSGAAGGYGADNNAWKGGTYKSKKGYWYVRITDHPRAMTNGYVKRATIAIEHKIGRYLKADEVAHHINGNKEDDEESNLELLTFSAHSLLHAAPRKKVRVLKPARRYIANEVPIERIRELSRTHSLRAVARLVGFSHETIRRHLKLN